MWYDLKLCDEKPSDKMKDSNNVKILKEFAYVYPEPTTHSHIKNCITFVRGVNVQKIDG